MADRLSRQTSLSTPRWLAWSVSTVLHACLLAGMFCLLRSPVADNADLELPRRADFLLQPWDDATEPPAGGEPIFEDHQTPDTIDLMQDLEIGENTPYRLPAEQRKTVAPAPVAVAQPAGQSQGRIADGTDRSGSNTARLRVFGNEAEGEKFVFLFDRSISMEGAPLRAAKSQLVANLALLRHSQQFQIVFFNHEPEIWDFPAAHPRLVPATASHRQLARKFVNRIASRGGTYRRRAMLVALELRADVIFFLTDADAPMAGRDLDDAARRARRQRTAIHTIEFGVTAHPPQENFLVQLARATRGQYVYVDTHNLERDAN